jgi:hypothetical protein
MALTLLWHCRRMAIVHPRRFRTLTYAIAVLATVITVVAGFCLFDDHAGTAHDHGVSIDLCLGMLGVANVVAPLIVLFATGWTVASLSLAVLPAPLHVLDPPPRFVSIR